MRFNSLYEIGNMMYKFRKKKGLTQAKVAEIAGISDRTYADIERGTVNMRVETLLQICKVLSVSPNELLVNKVEDKEMTAEDIQRILDNYEEKKRTLTELSNLINDLMK